MIRLTKQSMEFLIEDIVDAVESTYDRDEQFAMVKEILEGEGLAEVIEN